MTRKTSAAALGLMALAGCSFLHPDAEPAGNQVVATAYDGRAGTLVVPRVCRLDSAVITRPIGDPAIDEAAWRAADEQVIPLPIRQALASNGLRVGVITGSLPSEISDAFQEHPPLPQTEWVHFDLPEGVQTPITVRPRRVAEGEAGMATGSGSDVATLLVNNRGKVEGKDYLDASGIITVTADQRRTREVALRLVPAIHHGANRSGFAPIANAGPFAQQEFTFKSGQQEDARRDLAVTLDVQPGQYVVVGCRSQQERSLGTFLFTQAERNSDRELQSLLLIQAGRNNVGVEAPKREGGDLAPADPVPKMRTVKELPDFESKPKADADAMDR